MKNNGKFYRRLVLISISVVLLSSFLAFSSIPAALAESDTEQEQGINELALGHAWITSYDGFGGYEDIAYLEFGHNFGYKFELSPYIGRVVDTYSNSYVINWRPRFVGVSMYVCGVRVAYSLPDGAGGFDPNFSYVHIPGSVLFPNASSVEWGTDWTGGCIYLKSGSPYNIFNKNLNIPEGSRIDYLRVYYFREAEAEIFLPLIKR